MMTADEIVDLCGGTSALATALELTPSTVSSWREVNFIPRWWRKAVIGAARNEGKALEIANFPTPEQRVPRKRPALTSLESPQREAA